MINFKSLTGICFLGLLFAFQIFAQEQKQKEIDPLYSVYGPPKPAIWKFQLGYLSDNNISVSSFNFYKKDQRDRTLFISLINNGLDNTSQYRVQQISGGAVLFPFNDDDSYQFDIGGTFDKIKNSSLDNKTFFSRFTFRPNRELWLRVGYEYYDGQQAGRVRNIYDNSTLNSYYAAAKYKIDFASPLAVLGGGKSNENLNNRFGGGVLIEGPSEFYAFGGYIKSTDEIENTRTLAVGRYSPFRPDGLPSGFFIWKHKSDYDFQLGGIFFGERNRFVQPAAVGMLTGMFISSTTLRVNSQLRQRKLMAITDDYENADYSLFYVHLNQKISSKNSVGFTAVQFFKLFTNTEFGIFSDPLVSFHYNEETNPVFDMKTFSFSDKKENYLSYQVGIKVMHEFLIDAIHSPAKKNFTIALSYLIE